MKKLMLAVALLATSGVALAQDTVGQFQEGVHFFKIDPPLSGQPVDGVQVTEVFSYLCNHCNTFEPYMQSWKDRKPEGVMFSRIPVEFGRAIWSLYARAYVTADLLGVAEEAHVAMMDAIWKDRQQMRSMEEIAVFYADYGVDPEKFVATSKSFAVDMRMKNEQRAVRDAGVGGTPAMIVGGKYRIAARGAVNNYDLLLQIVDALVAQIKADEMAAADPTADSKADTAVATR
ncbi:MAG: thiol:disulfide interchange protein DsbA/DsbL [Pseudomonadota bacterium]